MKKAYEEESKARVWDLYLTQYPYMTEENFIDFGDYYATLTTPVSTKTEEEILSEIQNEIASVDWRSIDGNI